MPKAASTEPGRALPRVTANNIPAEILRRGNRGSIDPSVDLERRELWRAYQRGSLTEDELARSLQCLDFGHRW